MALLLVIYLTNLKNGITSSLSKQNLMKAKHLNFILCFRKTGFFCKETKKYKKYLIRVLLNIRKERKVETY